MKKTILNLMLALGLVAGTALAAEKSNLAKETELAKMAESASSASDHAQVAKHYRLRAEHFEAVAEEKQAELRKRQAGPQIGMSSKWPAMSRNNGKDLRDAVVQARRAAAESRELAGLHTQLAVEKGMTATEAAAIVKSDDRSGS